MKYRYDASDDILLYLRNQHSGADNAVQSAHLEFFFGISGAEIRQAVNKLRRNAQPVCSNVNGYFYARNADEINDTVQQLFERARKINDAAQGLVLSHQIFYNGTSG